MPCGKKRKRHKIATHKRKKRLRKNRHKNTRIICACKGYHFLSWNSHFFTLTYKLKPESFNLNLKNIYRRKVCLKNSRDWKFPLKKTFIHRRMGECCNLGQIQTKFSISKDDSFNQDDFLWVWCIDIKYPMLSRETTYKGGTANVWRPEQHI